MGISKSEKVDYNIVLKFDKMAFDIIKSRENSEIRLNELINEFLKSI